MSVNYDEELSVELDIEEPSGELLKFAQQNINEDSDRKLLALQELKDMIYEKGCFTPYSVEDRYLYKFLRPRNFDVEAAYKLMARYHRFRERNDYLLKNICHSRLTVVGDDGVIHVPPHFEQTGRRMLIYNIGKWDTSKYSMDDILKISLMVLELAVLEPRTQILGGICIFDLRQLGLQHFWQLSSKVAATIVQMFGISFPIKIHALHVLHESLVFHAAYLLFKPFLDQNMVKKIFIHGSDMEAFHSHVDPKYLPRSLGGTRPEYGYKQMLKGVINNPTLVEDMKLLGYEELDEETKLSLIE